MSVELKGDEKWTSENPAMDVRFIGESKTPIVVLDRYLPLAVDQLNNFAKTAQFKPDPVFLYPGVRAPLPQPYVIKSLSLIYRALYDVYNIPYEYQMRIKHTCMSLITQDESSLTDRQRIPHCDTAAPFFFAALHYLSDGTHGGTGFFRHGSSNVEVVNQENQNTYYDLTEKEENKESKYPSEQHPLYHCYDKVEYVKERFVIYPGSLLHSSLVDVETDISSDPVNGRLTANIFFNYESVQGENTL